MQIDPVAFQAQFAAILAEGGTPPLPLSPDKAQKIAALIAATPQAVHYFGAPGRDKAVQDFADAFWLVVRALFALIPEAPAPVGLHTTNETPPATKEPILKEEPPRFYVGDYTSTHPTAFSSEDAAFAAARRQTLEDGRRWTVVIEIGHVDPEPTN